MDDRKNMNSRGRSAKDGRPSNLAFYRQYWCPAASILPLDGAVVNCAEWFQLYGGYIFRTFSTGEATDLFDIPETMRTYIRGRLEQINTRPDEPEEPRGPRTAWRHVEGRIGHFTGWPAGPLVRTAREPEPEARPAVASPLE